MISFLLALLMVSPIMFYLAREEYKVYKARKEHDRKLDNLIAEVRKLDE